MKPTACPHLHTIGELAEFLDAPEATLRRLAALKRCPPWRWEEGWREPRWGLEHVPAWLRAIDSIRPEDLTGPCPPLRRSAGTET